MNFSSSTKYVSPSIFPDINTPSRHNTDTRDEQFIKDHYLPRFPELDSLVPLPLPFCRVLLALGNGPDLRGDITGLLTSGAIMAVKVTAATTKGVVLEEKEWEVVTEAVGIMFSLEESKNLVRSLLPPPSIRLHDRRN